MCAINGFTFNDSALIAKMNAATRHRGPDGTDIFSAEGISLGHNRLAIIDTGARAAQPMKSHDGRFVISFNGEIYNFKELRSSLAAHYPFITESDTEVLLAAWAVWGVGCLTRINGIFAFALWDTEKRELFLARDPVGVKPLYYYARKDIIFSSEIKGILAAHVSRSINTDAFDMYMRGGYVPAPLTLFQDILKLPAGHYARFRNGSLSVIAYTISCLPKFEQSENNISQILLSSFDSAMRRQLVADRPLGVYLSGGIDSSIILDSITRIRGSAPQTFSTGFTLNEREDRKKFNADADVAHRTAAWYGSEHHTVMCAPDEVIPLLHAGAWHLDEPIANPTIISMLSLARAARNAGIAVVMTGDGGDELFGGYERYRMSRRINVLSLLPSFLRPAAVRDAFDAFGRFSLFMRNKDAALYEIVRAEALSGAHEDFFKKAILDSTRLSGYSIENVLMDIDRRIWLVDEALLRTDKTAMAYGVEARVPFLDSAIVSLAARIPSYDKVNLLQTKIIIRKAFKNRLPPFVFNQPKRGWFSPAAKWMRRPTIHSHVRMMLSPDYCRSTQDLFHWDSLGRMLEDHVSGKRYNATMLWTAIAFQAWAHAFLSGTAHAYE